MEKTKTPTQALIDERGGAKAVAAKMGVGRTTVQMWKFRNRIPRTVWPEFLEAFPDVTIDDLKAVEAA